MKRITILALAAIKGQSKALIRGSESHRSDRKRAQSAGRRLKSSEGETLCAIVGDPYPGYAGIIRASGSVNATFPEEDRTEFSFDLQGLESDCIDCGVHIHAGTSCATASEVGGHHFATGTVDPWTPAGGAVYSTDATGSATGSFVVSSGFDTFSENIGHAVVIHAMDGTRLTCSILRRTTNGFCEPVENRELYASAKSPYPGYSGNIHVFGSVTVAFPAPDCLELSYHLQGLEASCENCGVHIHAGTTCDNAQQVGGHFFATKQDPWAAGGVAVYNSDANGLAQGSFRLQTGVDTYQDNMGHAVVVHGQDGARISCGILKSFANLMEDEMLLMERKDQ